MAAPLSDALIHDATPTRARANLKVIVLPFFIGLGCTLLWMCGNDPQTVEDFEAATSMSAQPQQMAKMATANAPRAVVVRVAYRDNKGNPVAGGQKSMKDDVVRNNLEGVSRFMGKPGWVDSQGRKGKGYGVYRFANKYGTNIDGYSPIYSPDEWTETGDTFSLGTKGLIAWAGLLVVLLAVGGSLIVSSSTSGA